jgi:phenylpropionate dioxygenase-like ring-hydroxylating dioxygenase large terminal subunit
MGLRRFHSPVHGLGFMSEWLRVCDSVDVPDGEARRFVVAEERVVVWRDSIGAAHVWRDYCPHRGALLSLGYVMRDQIVCPDHGWMFDIEGRCLRVPSSSAVNAAKRECAVTYEAEERDGVVWMRLSEAE